MRKARAPFKSFKSLISLKDQTTNLNPNLSFGETIIPIGSDNIEIGLPKLQNTFTYNIINTDRMSGNITLKTTEGASMIGLMLNSSGGSISIDPIVSPTSEMTLENDIKDGCYIQTLSNGNNWYVWSVATGGGINVKTNGTNINYPPTIVLPTPADITNVVITSDVRFNSALEARHDLTFSGEGEPGADLTITEDGGAIQPITIKIPSTGVWTVTRATDLQNASYTFDFNPTSGNGVQNKSFIGDTGPITFTVPSAFSPDPAEVVDFAAGASAVKPDGTPITVTVDSTAWNSGLAHGATFNIIYSITDAAVNGGVTVSQTVAGEIVDDTPPAAPVILAASIANMNELSANGTAEPGKTITLFQDSLALSPTVTSHASTGAWSIGPITLSLNSNFTLKAQASEPGVGNPNRSAFGEYSPAFNYVQPQVTKPTLTIDGETKSTWSNTAGTFTLRGTTEAGSAIAITADGQAVSPASGPTVVGTDWTATLTVANESQTNFKATATLANHLPNESGPYGLLIDRVAPTITLTGGAQTVGLPNVGSNLDLGFSASDSSSGVATLTSNWDAQVSTTTQGTYTVTYNATDIAGNSASPVTRYVTVTTEVIIPVITSVTANSNGTFTIAGTVTGTYADNLTVQITIDDSNSGSAVNVVGGAFTHTTSAQSPGTYAFKAKSINSATDESSLSSVQSATIAVPDTTAPVIVITNDADDSVITNTTVSITEGDTFAFTAAATDNIDGDISGNIVQGGHTLDTTTAGTYNLTFDVSDSASPIPNTDSATLTVEVSAVSGVFLEELSSAVSNLANGAVISSGIFEKESANGTTEVAMDSDGIMQFSGVNPVNTDFTLSFWFRPDDNFGTGHNYVMGKYAGSEPNSDFRIAMAKHSSGFIQFRPIIGGLSTNTPSALGFNSFVIGNWYHVAMTYKYNSSSSKYEFRTYLDGTPGGNKLDLTYSILDAFKSNRRFGIGRTASGAGFLGTSPDCSLDSIQFGDGIVLDDYQIQQIYNQSNRLMSIAAAQALTDPSPGSNSPTTFIEDNDDVISRNPGKINPSTGEFRDLDAGGNNSGLQVLLETDGVVQYSAGEPVNDEFTISWWMKPDATQSKSTAGVLGYSISNNRRLTLRITNATTGLSDPNYQIHIGTPSDGDQQVKYAAGPNSDIGDENWHHFAIRCQSNGSGALLTKLFVDGSVLTGQQGFANLGNRVPDGFKMLPPSSNESFYFGSAPDLNSSGNNGSIKAQFDSMQIGVVLTDSQIAAIAAQSDRLMSIATASGL